MLAGHQIPPDRRIDVLIAEKLFEFEPAFWHDQKGNVTDAENELVPNYSTDIAAAWQVVEKLRKGGFWFQVKQDNTDLWDAKAWTGEAKGWFPVEEFYATADSAPLAICLAALKAVGYSVSKEDE